LHNSKIEQVVMHLFLFHDIFVLCKRRKRGQYKVVAMETLVELLVSNISFHHEFGKKAEKMSFFIKKEWPLELDLF
jgi:HD superfamily phosphodiesterase